MNPIADFLIVLGLLIGMAFLVLSILRYTSCWNRLEKLYLTRSYRPAKNFGLQWINIGSPFDPSGTFNRFSWVIKVGSSENGVLVSGIGPLRLIFRPILIPWDGLIIAEQSFVGLKRYELIPLEMHEVQLILSTALARKLNQEMSNVNRLLSNEKCPPSLSPKVLEGKNRMRTE